MMIDPTSNLKLRTLERLSSPWALSACAWLYLSLTGPRGLMWFDSGELALAAHTWGLGHPPGQPFYQLLASLTSLTPDPLWALNQLSAIALALSIPALSVLWRSLCGGSGEVSGTYPEQVSGTYPEQPTSNLTPTEWLCGALWICLYPVWDQGARIEVYSLGLALGLWSLAQLTRSLSRPNASRPNASRLVIAGALLGLCGATQSIFAVGFGLAALPQLWLATRIKLSSLFIYGAGVVLGFLTPHLYLWWAVTRSVGFVWGSWDSPEALWHYFSGADYRLASYKLAHLGGNLSSWFGWALERGHALWCTLALIGVLGARRLSSGWWRLWWWLTPTTIFGALFPLMYAGYEPEVPDFSGYQLPTLALSLIGVWAGARLIKSKSALALIGGALTLSVMLSSPGLHERSRAAHHLPQTIAHHWLESLPERALLLVESDHWVFPLMYAQSVEGIRPDVVVFNTGFQRSSWYWRWLKRTHPELPSLAELDPRRTGAPRLLSLAKSREHVYLESHVLAAQLTSALAAMLPPPMVMTQPCASGWGLNLKCSSPTAPPSLSALRAWAQLPAHRDPITRRVLARLGLELTINAWGERRQNQALDLGYAPLGLTSPTRPATPTWWPLPLELRAAAAPGLIGSPEGLEALLAQLSH